MKIISTQLGRVVFLKPLQEYAPLGGVFLPPLYDAVRGRYGFTSVPDMNSKEPPKFSIGRIMSSGREYPVQELALHPDGLVCSADSTEIAEFFLGDLLSFLRDHFGFRQIDGQVLTLFLSQVWVQFEESTDALISKMEAIASLIEKITSPLYGIVGVPIQLHSLTFDYDRTRISPLLDSFAPFRIERKVRAPYDQNVLFSTAPLRTKDHLKALEKIEKIAGGS